MTQKNRAPIDSCVKVSWFSNHKILKSGLQYISHIYPLQLTIPQILQGKNIIIFQNQRRCLLGEPQCTISLNYFWGLRLPLFWWFWVPKIDCQLDVFDVILTAFSPLFIYKKKTSQVLLTKILRHHTHVFTFQASKKAPHLGRPTWHEPAVCSHPRWSVKACWNSVKSSYPNISKYPSKAMKSWFPAKRSSRFSDDIQPLFPVSEIFKQKAQKLTSCHNIYNLQTKLVVEVQACNSNCQHFHLMQSAAGIQAVCQSKPRASQGSWSEIQSRNQIPSNEVSSRHQIHSICSYMFNL